MQARAGRSSARNLYYRHLSLAALVLRRCRLLQAVASRSARYPDPSRGCLAVSPWPRAAGHGVRSPQSWEQGAQIGLPG